MQKTYDPKAIEASIYHAWQQAQVFEPTGSNTPYCIMLPPPNVTGSLHMGHGFQGTLIDILIRYHRMCGDKTLWQAGTDHAGIATQMVVERLLEKQNTSRHNLGRDEFIARVWQWKEQSGHHIAEQMQRLGTSCDWSRAHFTMDDNLSAAVQHAFIKLYEDGLIYRGKRLVNWDPTLLTAVSDLEVLNEEVQGSLWHIRYPLVDSDQHVIIATTRPETLLGDAAIAVHPDDHRYQALLGKQVALPLTNRCIPIIADAHVDPEFGTGCVKITPAHDFNDYEVGTRHQLPMINIFTPDAKINTNAPEAYRDLDRFVARQRIVQDLTTQGLLAKTQSHRLKIPRGDRSGAVIEPYLTDQWYINIASLAAPASKAVRDRRIQFVPENAKNLYFEWMDNIQDWCISRQLWWGHRIPAWYDEQDNVYIGASEAAVRAQHDLDATVVLRQDEDVLDTWFSAGLWPFAALGWPEKTPTLSDFYPTDVLVTGFDIIFFWVARMIMFGLYFMGDVPFKTVYFHGLIRDHAGQKMSKSKGNVIDPVDLIDGISLPDLMTKRTTGLMQSHLQDSIITATQQQFPGGIDAYGTDAVRFTFCALASRSRDINFDIKRLTGYRNFCNKLWNAARFVLLNVQAVLSLPTGEKTTDTTSLSLVDRWIYARLQKTIAACHRYIGEYRFDHLAQAIYEFVWHEYCDWYLELSKVTLQDKMASEAEKSRTCHTLMTILSHILHLAHPVIPFITEAIWQALQPYHDNTNQPPTKTLMLSPYPTVNHELEDDAVEQQVSWLQQIIVGIRNIRSEMNVAPGKQIPLMIKGASTRQQIQLAQLTPMMTLLARLSTIEFVDNDAPLPATASCFIGDMACHIPIAGLIDVQAETTRLNKEITKLQQEMSRLQHKLDNPNFINKAPQQVVMEVRERLAAAESKRREVEVQLNKLIH